MISSMAAALAGVKPGGSGRGAAGAGALPLLIFFPRVRCVTRVLVLRSKGRRAVRSQGQESGHSLVRGGERLARVARARAAVREHRWHLRVFMTITTGAGGSVVIVDARTLTRQWLAWWGW
jgi:hypothetical protein